MNIKSKEEIRDIVAKDLLSIHNRSVELRKRLDENFEDSVAYLRALISQLSQHSSGPLVAKTPKIVRKKAVQRIETIPENEVFQRENISSAESLQSVNEQKQETNEEMAGGRVKRRASKRAADNIKKQYSITLYGKLKQPSDENENENISTKKIKRESQVKRKKSATSSSDEEDTKSGSKYSRIDENLMETKRSTRRATKKKFEQIDERQPIVALTKINQIEKIEKRNISQSPKSIRSSRSSSKKFQKEEVNEVDDVTSNIDDIEEPSMYEDAIGKPIPIMNSTMKSNSVLSGKILNATVVLGRLSQKKLNETMVIQKAPSKKNGQSEESVRNNLQSNEQTIQYNNYNELITDDESSSEKGQKKQNTKNEKKRAISTSEDEIPNTPMKARIKDTTASTAAQEARITYKSNALFSPYAKESVKKRVEAFEQAVMYSPKSVDVDIPTRITRTKTRAMAAETETNNAEKNVAQILARKSLAKAKKISLAKQKKGNEEFKENKEQMPERITKLLLNDKPIIKLTQLQKVTPLSKIRMIQPSMSANRTHTPSHVQNLLNYPKALTVSRSNIVSNIDSFIQPPKSISKATSVEKLEDKRRHEEDAKKKREEALRLQTEEKKRKRQEKELKNKLAREAKKQQELEKRQKAEREREEKAKLALLMQEKQREELEKKRFAQLQRAQEKEERRKLEEQQRLQKLQEQEETERLLAEQKRREQEAEKRKEVEARAQAAEALKQKNQMLAAQAKYKQANNKNQATNYVLDSDPDDDDSDDESRPKHEIPYWAQPHVRKAQLALQRNIGQETVYKFFDTRKCTPNLAELFTGIDRTRLERTSSAIWKTPPRFSMMET
ncbi:Inner centromere protein A [Formica fusca]